MITPDGINGITVTTQTKLGILFEDLADKIAQSPECASMTSSEVEERIIDGLFDIDWIHTNFIAYFEQARKRFISDNSPSVG